jgi:two-component system C4-dicarboxylate transport response regulator DctD
MTGTVILIDDEKHLRAACTQSLELAGFSVDSYSGAVGALDIVNSQWLGVIVSDVRMPGMDGMALLSAALERDSEIPVVLITGHGDVPMAVQAMRDGAYDFIQKPFAPEVLVDAVRRALDKRRLILENRNLRDALDSGSPLERLIIGESEATQHLRAQIADFAVTDADVLIFGETGTGKELVARALHEMGPRSGHKFVPVNCGALPDTIIESELFGHEKGAFTGASQTRIGKFEYADGGTIFLDEIESMPVELQARLLRVLEERTVVKLGSNDEIPFDVRVIAATKSDLQSAANKGEFREDLYYRLNVLEITIPPLRDRPDDIEPLILNFFEQAQSRFKRSVDDIDPATMSQFKSHAWPGNVRELKNSVMRYVLGQGREPVSGAGEDERDDAPAEILPEQLATFEADVIQACLAKHGYKLKPTYEELGISRKTLYEKMKRYGIIA